MKTLILFITLLFFGCSDNLINSNKMATQHIGKTQIEAVETGTLKGAKLDYVESFAFAFLQPVDAADVPNGCIFIQASDGGLYFKSHIDGTLFLIAATKKL